MNYQEMSREQLIAELEERDRIFKTRKDLLSKIDSIAADPNPHKKKLQELQDKISPQRYKEQDEESDDDFDWENEWAEGHGEPKRRR